MNLTRQKEHLYLVLQDYSEYATHSIDPAYDTIGLNTDDDSGTNQVNPGNILIAGALMIEGNKHTSSEMSQLICGSSVF